MKTFVALLSGLFFLVGCHSSVSQEKPPEWPPPMTRTEIAESSARNPADQYLAMKYFRNRPVAAQAGSTLPGNEIDRAKALLRAEKKQKKSLKYAEAGKKNRPLPGPPFSVPYCVPE